MSIPLRVVSETDTTVTLGWDPVPGAQGYRFSSSLTAKRSHTWDPLRSQVRFAKGADWYRVEALGVVAEGEWPVAEPPVSSGVLGCAWNATGLANLEIGKTDREVAIRFRAERTGRLTGCRVYLKHGSGYSAGTGGKIRCDLHAEDGYGRPGVLLASSAVIPDPLASSFRTFSLDVNVTEGARYCLVFVNTDPAQATNYVSLNSMNHPALTPRQPETPDADLAVLYRDGTRAWGGDHPERTPIFELAYADGSRQGQTYVDFMPSQRVTLGQVTQTLTPRATRSFGKVRAWIAGAGTVTFELAGKTATAEKSDAGLGWVEEPLEVTLDAGQSYPLVVTGEGVSIFPYQKGTAYGFADPLPEGRGPAPDRDWPVYLDAAEQPPVEEGEIPAFAVRLTPNWVSSQDSASSNYNALWVYPRSPTTPYLSPDSHKQVTRYLLLDPRYEDAQGIAGRDEWWFVIERYWPSDFDPNQHGKWGREVNFHNVAGDAGPPGSGGVGWGFGAGSSALALDWQGTPSPTIAVLTAYRSQGGFEVVLPVPARDVWHTYLVHWVAGRTDGTTVRPGAITVWADGDKVVDRTGLNTVQRAQGPDGNWYVQRWMVLWEGDYTQALPETAETRFALTRVGSTLAECLADRPERASDNAATMYYRGTGANVGPPTVTALEPRPAGAARIPAGVA